MQYCSISYNVSSIVSNFIYLSLLSYFLSLTKVLPIVFIVSENQFLFFWSLIYFHYDLCLLLSANVGLSLFFLVPRTVKFGRLLESFLCFPNIWLYHYKHPSKNCFWSIPYIWVYFPFHLFWQIFWFHFWFLLLHSVLIQQYMF